MVIFFRSLFILVFLASAKGQYMDAIVPVQFKDPGQAFRSNDQYQLSGNSIDLNQSIIIEGGAIRFSGDTSATVWVQFLRPDGQWTDKTQAKIFIEPNSDRFIASVLDSTIGQVSGMRYSVESSELVQFISGGFYDIKDREPTSRDFTPKLKTKYLVVDKPKIISRSEWGAKDPKYSYSNHPYFDKLTLHHAAGWGAKTLDEGKAAVKSIQEFHQDGRGWSDIGYHFVVDMSGNIYQGRPETVLGAHVGGANTGNIGVCILGCYHPPETSITCQDKMTYNTEKSLIHLYAWISDTYGIQPTVLKGHRDYFGTTSCPGDNVWPLLPQIRAEIALFIQYGEQPTRFALFQNYPNPFNATTTLHYDIPEPADVKIVIYDILGRRVKELVNQTQYYGYKKIIWDGKDDMGVLVAAGVYFFRAELGPLSETRKMVLLK